MDNSIPGPNPAWGVLYELREDPLHFILYARLRAPEELASVRFTARWLTEAWGVDEERTQRAASARHIGRGDMHPVDQVQTPTPAKGAPRTNVFDANGLLAWVAQLSQVRWGNSAQQDRTLFRMVKAHREQHAKDLAAGKKFDAAIRYLQADACMAILDERFPGAPYTKKARAFLVETDT